MKNSLEILEARIAPAAAAPLLPTTEFNAQGQPNYVTATPGAPVEIHAGQVLSTGGFNSGAYLLFVQKGEALVFFTDLNNNRTVDFNELTGIAAGDNLEMIVFTDIHGDIATNLRETVTVNPGGGSSVSLALSDSDGNTTNDDVRLGGDGRVLLNKAIGKIELRTIQTTDINDITGPNQLPDGIVDNFDTLAHQAPTTCSIFGSIYAGRGFGTADGKGGLIIDATGAPNFGFEVTPTIGSIRTGTAASGEFFSFGASNGNSSGVQQIFNDDGTPFRDANGQLVFEQDNPNASGTFVNFIPARGQSGGDIVGLKVLNSTTLNLDTLQAGNGGVGGGAGGNVLNITIPKDDSGGYRIIAGNGGTGPNGGAGGSILNLSDANSTTGLVVIQTGSGGTGVTGAGGNGGNFTFGVFSPRADSHILLGDGGDGFTVGGNGASFLKGDLAQADALTAVAAIAGTGSTHIPSSKNNGAGDNYVDRLQIGQHSAIDFNGDGYGDFVFTTGGGVSQLVVQLGDPQGTFNKYDPTTGELLVDAAGHYISNRIALSGARNAQALCVADIDNDGHPDIIVGSSDAGSQQGLVTFLSQYDSNDNFLGFRSPRFSVLPQLETGDSSTINYILTDGFEAPHQIGAIEAGDFNGDGKIELAVVVTGYAFETSSGNQVTALTKPFQEVIFMQPDVQYDYLNKVGGVPTQFVTGQFYADFGTKGFRTQQQTVDPAPKYPLFFIKNGATGVGKLQASPQDVSSDHDVLFAGGVGDSSISALTYSVRDASFPPVAAIYDLGSYDSNRGSDITVTALKLKEFAIFDYNNDGLADLVAFDARDFLVGVQGQDDGSGLQVSGGGGGTVVNQAGNDFSAQGLKLNTLIQVRTAEIASLTSPDGLEHRNFTLLSSTQGAVPSTTVANYAFREGPGNVALQLSLTLLDLGATLSDAAFDYHYAAVDDPAAIFAGSSSLAGKEEVYFENALLPAAFNFEHIGLELAAGDGGNSLLGKGGNGGSLGSGSLTSTTSSASGTPTTVVKGALNLTLAGDIVLPAGSGGDGFTSGGIGGSVTGTALIYRGNDIGVGLVATAGDGGRGVSGVGGLGGSIARNSFETSARQAGIVNPFTADSAFTAVLVAGSGGDGTVGGGGGSVVGNGISTRFDTFSSTIVATAGSGGNGSKVGGAGGSIAKFHPTLPVSSISLGDLVYTAGNGGSAVSGPGGAGGSITDSSPAALGYINGALITYAGDGGDGAIGGNGGSVTNFIVSYVSGSLPGYVSAHGGHGGDASSGRGGNGGSVVSFSASSSGLLFNFNSILAGDGGDSGGSTGGNGGSVVKVTTSSQDGSYAVVAGAGGDGLFRGGIGGGISSVNLALGASTSKGLIIAGAGGDSTAFVVNNGKSVLTGRPLDPSPNQTQNSFGGVVGVGGLGGTINGFLQTGNKDAHFDFIAGNGGSTLNYGTFFDKVSFVGNGGSVLNVQVTGNIGNPAPEVPIKSYNDLSAGQTVADFVNDNLRNNSALLDDALGNVGIIVGSAGSNKQFILNPTDKPQVPTTAIGATSKNGSLVNITFGQLTSAVAGSVESIASIQVARNLNATGSGERARLYGADKGITADNAQPGQEFRNYLDVTGEPVTAPVVGGALVDGAIVARVFQDAKGNPINRIGREFERG